VTAVVTEDSHQSEDRLQIFGHSARSGASWIEQSSTSGLGTTQPATRNETLRFRQVFCIGWPGRAWGVSPRMMVAQYGVQLWLESTHTPEPTVPNPLIPQFGYMGTLKETVSAQVAFLLDEQAHSDGVKLVPA